MTRDISRVLVLGPHTDDGEFGCGATIARFVEQGADVHYAMFSLCRQSVPEGYPEEVLRDEATEACEELGLGEDALVFFDYPVREFPAHRQEILENLVDMRDRLDPDLVIMPCGDDTHQDHETVHQEGWRAFKYRRVLGYEVPWNSRQFANDCFVTVTRDHIDKKMAALGRYESQRFRHYADEGFIRGLARMRGVQTRAEFAEAFELLRWSL